MLGGREFSCAKQYNCKICHLSFGNRHSLFVHKRLEHAGLDMVGGGESSGEDGSESTAGSESDLPPLKSVPWDADSNPFDQSDDPNAVLWQVVYNIHKQEILEGDIDYGIYSTYNFPLPGELTNEMLREQIEYIHEQQSTVYKIYCSPGYILERRENEDFKGLSKVRYFAPYSNNYLSPDETAILVTSTKDLEGVIAHFQSIDPNAFADRPSSAYKVVFWCNLKYYVYKLARPLGAKNSKLPDYVSSNRALCLTAEPVPDNLCLFVALVEFNIWKEKGALFDRSKHCRRLLRPAKDLLRKYIAYLKGKSGISKKAIDALKRKDFPGVQQAHLPHFEQCFAVNVNLYQLLNSKSSKLVYHSKMCHKDTMYLNITDCNHVNLILDWEKYCGNYLCEMCSRFFTRRRNMKTHQLVCSQRSKIVMQNGFLRHKKHIFSRLLELGISIPEYVSDQNVSVNQYFTVWDCESLLENTAMKSGSQNLMYMQGHRVFCVSIASNIPGHTQGKAILNDNSDELVISLFEEFDSIQNSLKTIMLDRWGHVLAQIDHQISIRESKLEIQRETLQEQASVLEVKTQIGKFTDPALTILKECRQELKAYLFELVIISFNGSMYDSNLCRRKLFSCILEKCKNDHIKDVEKSKNERIRDVAVLKRRNKYLMIRKREKYVMVDLANYLAVGISLRKFIAMYACSEEKSYFPYTFLNEFSKLEEANLPEYPGKYWMNDISKIDLLQEEHYQWEKSPNKAKIPEPKTGEEKYRTIMLEWQTKGFKNVRDYLIDYALRDVVPHVEAITQFQQIWKTQNVECFKQAVSLPGLSNILMWKDSIKEGINFPLIANRDRHFYLMVRENIVAGQSIVFTRLQEQGRTRVGLNSKYIAKSLVGYDCSNLYGYVMSCSMPIMTYIYRQKPEFKPEFSPRYRMMYVYNKYLEKKYKAPVISKQTHGYDVRMGPYYLDGLILVKDPISGEMTRIAVSYQGCLFHGDRRPNCPMFKRHGHKPWYQERYANTVRRDKDLKAMGLKLESMWDCVFRKEHLSQNAWLRAEEKKFLPDFYQSYKGKGKTEEKTLLSAVLTGTLFGLLLVDVYVYAEYAHYYASFPVLFGTSTISKGDLNEEMRNFIDMTGTEFTSRRLLISENNAKNLLISSDYVRFLLETKHFAITVHEVFEFCRGQPFKKYVNFGTEKRRTAVNDPTKRAMGYCWKYLLNASYGKIIQNIDKLNDISYVDGDSKAQEAMSDPRFKSVSLLNRTEGLYEVCNSKRKTKVNTCFYMGIFILSRAKVEVLKFVYRMLYAYIDPQKVGIIHTDTDSIYMALAAETFERSVRAGKRYEYNKMIYARCGHKLPAEHTFLLPRKCCNTCSSFDSLQPGLWQIEAEFSLCISLSSKSYLCFNRESGMIKISSKGLDKRNILRQNDPVDIYSSVLATRNDYFGENRGFRVLNYPNREGGIVTYSQVKKGLGWLYLKRHLVGNSLIYSEPLGKVLNNCPFSGLIIQKHANCLSMEHKYPFKYGGNIFSTLLQALAYVLLTIPSRSDQNCVMMNKVMKMDVGGLYKELFKMFNGCGSIANLELAKGYLYNLLCAKVQQVNCCKHILTKYKGIRIYNANPQDGILGVCLSYQELQWTRPKSVPGQNILGLSWERVSNQL